MDRSNSEDSFLADLEKAAKALSVVNDRASTEELRRLFDRLQEQEPTASCSDGPTARTHGAASPSCPLADAAALDQSPVASAQPPTTEGAPTR